MLKNDLLLQALSCRNTSRPPVWLMRQAGRYLPEYRAVRAKHSFIEMLRTPELAAEVSLQPIRRFSFDAAIVFSDILVILEALGLRWSYRDGEGPLVETPLCTEADVDALETLDVETRLNYVSRAIQLLLPQLEVPLLGFCGAPFTIASYIIEGHTSRDLKKTKQWMYRHPESFHRLLQKITDVTVDYLNLQIASGVHAIQIFDSWANALTPKAFREFALVYIEQILRRLKKPETPTILFCRGSSFLAHELASLNPRAISLDWNCDITTMRQKIPNTIALQGNIDPCLLYGTPQLLETELRYVLKGMQGDPGFIFNLGHGILPETPVDNVKLLVDTVKNF